MRGGATCVAGGSVGAAAGSPGAFAATRAGGAASAAAGPFRCGMTRCCPACTSAGLLMLLACIMAATGTPYRRDSVSSVSCERSVTGVPPSQLQDGGGGGAAAGGSEPVTSELAGTEG